MRNIVLTALIFLTELVSAQTGNDFLAAVSFVDQGKVKIRWSPVNPDLFVLGLKNGYLVERTSLGTGKAGETGFHPDSLASFFIPVAESMDSSYFHQMEMIRKISKNHSDQERDLLFALMLLEAGVNQNTSRFYGLYFEDSTAHPGNFAYRISIRNYPEKNIVIRVNTEIQDIHQPLSELKASLENEAVHLSWNAARMTSCSGFMIWKSDDSVNFYKITESPYIFFSSRLEENKTDAIYTDTVLQEGKKYFYRVTGINHFGEEGPAGNIAEVYIPFTYKGFPLIDSLSINNRKIRIHFSLSDREGIEIVNEMQLLASEKISGIYYPAGLKAFNYRDMVMEDTILRNHVFYKIRLLTREGDTIESHPYYSFFTDSIAPWQPENISGAASENGEVKITWEHGKENDIMGYRVFRSNALHEEFVEVTKKFLTDPAFTDFLPLNTLEESVYYYVVAADNNYNNSLPSDTIKIARTDTIPPVTPVIYSVVQDPRGAILQWYPSSSTDITKTDLHRKVGPLDTIITSFRNDICFFYDTTLIPGKHIEYYFAVSDASSNLNVSSPVTIYFEPGTRKKIEITSECDRNRKEIILRWNVDQEVYSALIYRSKNNGSFRLIKTIIGEKEVFVDNDLSINNNYYYRLQIIYKNGIRSEMSDTEEVVY